MRERAGGTPSLRRSDVSGGAAHYRVWLAPDRRRQADGARPEAPDTFGVNARHHTSPPFF